MAEKTIDIALESTSQEILSKANTLALETTAQSILTAAQEAKTAAENANSAVSGGLSAVKSVQRGVKVDASSSLSITINEVNPDKCMFIVDALYTSSTANAGTGVYVTKVTSTSFNIGNSGSNNIISWQVIEFA